MLAGTSFPSHQLFSWLCVRSCASQLYKIAYTTFPSNIHIFISIDTALSLSPNSLHSPQNVCSLLYRVANHYVCLCIQSSKLLFVPVLHLSELSHHHLHFHRYYTSSLYSIIFSVSFPIHHTLPNSVTRFADSPCYMQQEVCHSETKASSPRISVLILHHTYPLFPNSIILLPHHSIHEDIKQPWRHHTSLSQSNLYWEILISSAYCPTCHTCESLSLLSSVFHPTRKPVMTATSLSY